MADNVRQMPGISPSIKMRGSIPNAALIERLEIMLDEAKAGDLQSIIYSCLYADDATTGSWVTAGNIKDAMTLLGRTVVINQEFSTMIQGVLGE